MHVASASEVCERTFVNRGTGRDAASILHADLDAFYASVEQRDDPALRGKPVVAGRGVVLAASYEAKRFGVRTAMSETIARRLCPELIVVPAHFAAYSEASRAVFDVFRDTTPLVEGISIDEAFLDVAGLWRIAGSPLAIARELRRRVRDEVGLAITVGIARTKFLAKVASGVGKPDGLLRVDPAHELEFLHPLPVDKLWGVGKVTADKLEARGIRTVGEVAKLDPASLTAIVGTSSGRQLHALAHNIDARRVEVGIRRRSIGSQQALGRSSRSFAELDVILLRLVDRVTHRLRKSDRIGRTVTLRFRFDDFTRSTRSSSLPCATSSTAPLLAVARALLDAARTTIDERGLTLIGLSIANLNDAAADGGAQLTLPFERNESERIDAAIDGVRARFGSASLTRAATIGSDPEFGVPMLPD
jgi:DNA polymerase IV